MRPIFVLLGLVLGCRSTRGSCFVLLPAFSAFRYTGRVVFVSGDLAKKVFSGKNVFEAKLAPQMLLWLFLSAAFVGF